MDPYDAMQLYMDKVKELAQIYQVDEELESSEEQEQQQQQDKQ